MLLIRWSWLFGPVDEKLAQYVLAEGRLGPLPVVENGEHLPFRCRLSGKKEKKIEIGNLFLTTFKNVSEFYKKQIKSKNEFA